MKNKHIPMRRCVICRNSCEQSELLRATIQEDGLLKFDEKNRSMGRGYYVCHNNECLERVKKYKPKKHF